MELTKTKRTLSRKTKKTLFVAGMLTIPVIHFFVFWLWINVDSILLAFQDMLGGWVGMKNIEWVFTAFTSNPDLSMAEATRNTLIFFFWNLLVEMPLAVVLAYVFFKKLPGNKFFTVCLYLPCIIPGTFSVMVFKNFIGSDGPIALLYKSLGKTWTYPVTQDSTSMITMLAYKFWVGYGLNIILFRSAMARIPKDIFEAAALDGITCGKELTHIIVPLIWGQVSTMMILAVCGIFGADGPILIFTNGKYGTMTIGFAMYQQYKVYGFANRAAAIGLIYTAIGLPLVFGARALANKIGGNYEY